MADRKQAYGSWADFTITLASLASSSTLLVGRESTVVDNTTNKYLDYLIGGHITTGTTPTAAKVIEIWVYADVTGSTTYPDVLDGTDSAETFTDAESKRSALKLAKVIEVDATSDQTYWIENFSLAQLFGGRCPQKFGLFVTHDSAVNLNSTGSNHKLSHLGLFETVA